MTNGHSAGASWRWIAKLAIPFILVAHSLGAQGTYETGPVVKISDPVTVMFWNRPVSLG